MTLAEYVVNHTERDECRCGKCIDVGSRPDPAGHTADVYFFPVASINNPHADDLVALVKAHQGSFLEVNPFDGGEHSYIELGAWIGDQGLAMQFMGLCQLLGLGVVLTPNMFPFFDKPTRDKMAGAGLVTYKHHVK